MVLSQDIPVLLIRGLMREQRHWGEFRPILMQSLPNPLLSFDFAGTGALFTQTSPSNISGLRQSVRQQLQQEPTFKGKVHLVAISLGAMLAMDWLQHFPAEVVSLTAINSSVRSLSPFYQRLNWRVYPELFRVSVASPAQRERYILRLTSANPQRYAQTLEQWQRWQQQRPVSKGNALRQLWAASRFCLNDKPQCPSLIVSSKGDRLVNPACSAALAQFLRSDLMQHPWAGHDIALDDPHWLALQLATFIAKQ